MRVRLRAQGGANGKPRVDRKGHGRINGLSVAKKGPALGHGFELDDKSLDLIAEQLAGGKGRWTHGDPCGDSLGQHLGSWENLRRSGDHVVGDFAFSPLAKHVQPEGLSVDAPTYLMDMAEAEPDAAGLSVVVALAPHEELKGADGKPLLDEHGNQRLAARPRETPRADFVADPAANPDGLLAPSAALSEATSLLDRAARVHGQRNVRAALHAWLQATPEEESPMPCKTCGKNGADCACPKPEAEKPKAEAKPEADMAARLAKLEAAAAENAATIATLKAENETLKKAASDRVAADDAAYVESLRQASAEAQAPIDAAKLAKVVELQKAGQRDAARTVGDALLEAARAKNQTKAELRFANGVTQSSSASAATGVNGAKALLEAVGFQVGLSPDGTKITSADKPTRK